MEINQLEQTASEVSIANISLSNGAYDKKSSAEESYLGSMMKTVRQEGYTCVSGCKDCVSCGGND